MRNTIHTDDGGAIKTCLMSLITQQFNLVCNFSNFSIFLGKWTEQATNILTFLSDGKSTPIDLGGGNCWKVVFDGISMYEL
jgi:hypothetical protein